MIKNSFGREKVTTAVNTSGEYGQLIQLSLGVCVFTHTPGQGEAAEARLTWKVVEVLTFSGTRVCILLAIYLWVIFSKIVSDFISPPFHCRKHNVLLLSLD